MEALARRTDPDTSHEAAASVKVQKVEARVLRAMAEMDGVGTWDLISDRSGLRPGTVSPRFAPLRGKGLIVESGSLRPGSSGRSQTLWRLTPLGRLWVRDNPGPDPEPILPEGPAQRALRPDHALARVLVRKIEAVTHEDWARVLDGQGQMKGWLRKRAKRLVRLLLEGRAYDTQEEVRR
jgi:DNA-binding MarR family transcriptional regulator